MREERSSNQIAARDMSIQTTTALVPSNRDDMPPQDMTDATGDILNEATSRTHDVVRGISNDPHSHIFTNRSLVESYVIGNVVNESTSCVLDLAANVVNDPHNHTFNNTRLG